MRTSEAARRYALALYQTAKEQQKADAVLAELRALEKAFQQDPEIKGFVLSPLIAPDQKCSALSSALVGKVSDQTKNLLLLLAQKNRLPLFFEISQAYEEIIDNDNGVTRGTVRSAAPLPPEAIKSLEQTVNKVVNKKVILTFKEDPSLLGGMVAQVGGWTFDDSLDLHLRKMNEELNRRVN